MQIAFPFAFFCLLLLLPLCVSAYPASTDANQRNTSFVSMQNSDVDAYPVREGERSTRVSTLSQSEQNKLDKMSEGEKNALFQKTKNDAEYGDQEAQVTLSKFYEYGVGVQQDLIHAYLWLRLPQDNGNFQYQQQLSNIEIRMTKEQRVQAEQLAKQFTTKWSTAYIYHNVMSEDERKAMAIRYLAGINAIQKQLNAEAKTHCPDIPRDELGVPIGGSKLHVRDIQCENEVLRQGDDRTRDYFKSFFIREGVEGFDRLVLLSEAKQKRWKSAVNSKDRCSHPEYGGNLPKVMCERIQGLQEK